MYPENVMAIFTWENVCSRNDKLNHNNVNHKYNWSQVGFYQKLGLNGIVLVNYFTKTI